MLRKLIVALLLTGVAVPTAMAQPRRRGPAQVADNRKVKPADRAAKRERVKQRIRIMRAMVLTEQLDLDEATAGKMFPILGRYDDELAKLLGERASLRAKLDRARTGAAGDINRLLDQLVANQRARWSAEEQRFADLRALLTPVQAAKLLDLLPEVDRKILRGLRGAVSDDNDDARRGPDLGGDLVPNPFSNRN